MNPTKSEETRRRMSESQKKRWAERREVYLQDLLSHHVGAKRSEATRRKMAATHRMLAAVGTALVDDRGQRYDSAKAAAVALGTTARAVRASVRTGRTVCGRTLVRS